MLKIKKEHFRKYIGPFSEIVFKPRVHHNYIWITNEEAIKRAVSKTEKYEIKQIIKKAKNDGYDSKNLIKAVGKLRFKNFSHEDYDGVFISFAKIGKYLSEKEGKDRTKNIFKTEKTMEEILKFLKQYGPLKIDSVLYQSAEYTIGEMVNAYNLLTLYNAVLNKDIEQLKKRIQIGGKYPFVLANEKMEELFFPIIDGKKYPIQFMLKKPIDYLACAFYYISCEIRDRVEDVYPGFGNIEKLKSENWPEDIEHPGMFFNSVLVCPSLLSYMYLRFYLVITNMRPVSTCKECGIPFFPKRVKKDNKFCGSSCRIKCWKRNNNLSV